MSNNLKQERLKKLNNLLMEQSDPELLHEQEGVIGTVAELVFQVQAMKGGQRILVSIIDKVGKGSAVPTEGIVDAITKGGGKGKRAAIREAFRRLGPKATRFGTKLAQELVLSLGKRGYGTKILQRLMSSPSIARFITQRLGMSVLASGELAGATASMASFGGGSVAGAGLATTAATVAAGAALGTAIGYGLNKAFTAADLKGEIEDRFKKAKEDVNYAKAELDVYCKGSGGLCGDDVKCSGEPGGYVYETAEGLGIGAGRELFGVPGFRTYKQVANSFHANDGAMMIGLASAIALHDLKNGKIVLPNKENNLKKAEIASDAVSKQYQDCIKKWITQSSVMTSQAKRLGMEEAYGNLALVYGEKAFPKKLLDQDKKKGDASPEGPEKDSKKCDGTYPISFGCQGRSVSNMLGILVQGTKKGGEIYSSNKEKVTQLWKGAVFNEDVKDILLQVLNSDEVKPAYPDLAAEFEKKQSIKSITDPVAIFLNDLAREKNLKEGISSGTILLEENYLQKRHLLLNKILMGRPE